MNLASAVRLGFSLLVGTLTMVAEPGTAGSGGFTATLSSEQRDAAGLNALNDTERAALDQLVADDLAFARREKVTEFTGTFLARRRESARKEAGLDRLTPAQLTKLNELVATALAARPIPKERPRLKESDVLTQRRGEIHGSVTLAYGWGAGGRDFRAGSLWLDYYDPASRVGIGVGITSVSGGGFYGYGPAYYPDQFYPASYRYGDDDDATPPFIITGDRGDFQGNGSCFRLGSPTWHGSGRRR